MRNIFGLMASREPISRSQLVMGTMSHPSHQLALEDVTSGNDCDTVDRAPSAVPILSEFTYQDL
jgi:hypothetical protein